MASKKILLIEGDPVLRLSISEALGNAGYNVLIAADPAVGLVKALQQDPDLIIMEIVMSGMSAYQMIERLRIGAVITQKTPIIVLSGKKGMTDYFDIFSRVTVLEKPFMIGDFLDCVRFVSEKFGREAFLGTRTSFEEILPRDGDLSSARIPKKLLVAGVDELLMHRMKLLMTDMGHAAETALTVEEAVAAVERSTPDMVFIQQYPYSARFDALRLFSYCSHRPGNSALSCVVFYRWELDFVDYKAMSGAYFLCFKDADDLLNKVARLFR
jgi:DNA-binding response OmpR family regulator